MTIDQLKKITQEWCKALWHWAAIFSLIYVVFLCAGYGWYNGKSIANLQDNVRILEAYIAKQEQ